MKFVATPASSDMDWHGDAASFEHKDVDDQRYRQFDCVNIDLSLLTRSYKAEVYEKKESVNDHRYWILLFGFTLKYIHTLIKNRQLLVTEIFPVERVVQHRHWCESRCPRSWPVEDKISQISLNLDVLGTTYCHRHLLYVLSDHQGWFN
jgi:hypothetical protein